MVTQGLNGKTETRLINGPATAEQIRVLELAAKIQNKSRGAFMIDEAYEAGKRILEQQAPQLLQQSA